MVAHKTAASLEKSDPDKREDMYDEAFVTNIAIKSKQQFFYNIFAPSPAFAISSSE